MGPRVLVVADDVTGATDASVQFVGRGLRAAVLLTPRLWCRQDAGELPAVFPEPPDVLALNTQSRSSPPDDIRQRMGAAARVIRELQPQLVLKKVDSTFRGNVGLEVTLLAEALAPDVVLVAPSYPALARVIVGGYLLIHGQLVTATEVAKDPATPVSDAHLPSLLRSQTGLPVGHLELRHVCRGHDAIVSRLVRLRDEGVRVVACDAVSDEDLLHIARAATGLYRRILWVGAAGLAAALAELAGGLAGRPSPSSGLENRCEPPVPGGGQPGAPPAVLVVVGSLSRVARAQLGALATSGVPVTVLDPDALYSDFNQAARSAACKAGSALRGTGSARSPSDRSPVAALATSDRRSSLQGLHAGAAGVVPHLVGRVTAMLDVPPGTALVLTGGDTAYGVLDEAGCVGLRVCRELMPGVPLSLAVAGCFDRSPVVTKAGGFGDETALLRIVDMLLNRC